MTARYLWGLDLSLSNTGITVVDLENRKFVCICSVSTDKVKSKKGLYHNALKLDHIHSFLQELALKYKPDVIAIERGFSQFNTATQVLFRVHGVVNHMFKDIPQIYYPPKTVKEAILHGTATKAQLQTSIQTKYETLVFANEDESDSFAVALTYLIKEGIIEWIKPEKPKPKKRKKSTKEEV